MFFNIKLWASIVWVLKANGDKRWDSHDMLFSGRAKRKRRMNVEEGGELFNELFKKAL